MATMKARRSRHLVAVEGGAMVCLDSAEEYMVPALALNADRVLDETWNGWARPIATAAAFSDFLARWRLSDRHGTWGGVIEIDGQLRYEDTEGGDPEDFPRVGRTSSGAPLYDFTGWVWVSI